MMGIKQEPAETYHAQTEFVGSSSLKYMALSPAHFYNAWRGEAIDQTDAMINGTMLHSLLLEQDVEKFVARPQKDGRLVASNTKDYAAFLAANPGKTPIHPDLHSQLYAALTAFIENKTAMKMLEGAKIEHSVYATDHDTGLQIKARPDIWGANYIVDLKTVSGKVDHLFQKKIFNLGYDLQMAHYAETIFAATGELITDHYIIAFEQNPPFASRIFRLSRKDMASAKATRRAYLNEIAVCLEENKWPSYREEIIEVERPAFLEVEHVSFEGVG